MSDTKKSVCGIRRDVTGGGAEYETWCDRKVSHVEVMAGGVKCTTVVREMTCTKCFDAQPPALHGRARTFEEQPGARTVVCAIRGRPTPGQIETWCGRIITAMMAGAAGEVTSNPAKVTCEVCRNAVGDEDTVPTAMDADGKSAVEAAIEDGLLAEVPRELEVAVKAVKIEDGDLVIAMVPVTLPIEQSNHFRKHLQNVVDRDIEVKAKVIVVTGEVDISVVKKAELGDLHQRLDDLELAIEQLRHDMLG